MNRLKALFAFPSPPVFFFLLLMCSFLGLTDDEAYYWVLSQKIALGYAYHPPFVAWTIRLFDMLFNWTSLPAEILIRLPACFLTSISFALFSASLQPESEPSSFSQKKILFAFFPVFALGWMMVPDTGLFLGLALFFFLNKNAQRYPSLQNTLLYFLAAFVSQLSKYSGALLCFSAFCLVFWENKPNKKKYGLAIALGCLAAWLPILIWNHQHEWSSILYQIRDRHQGAHFSLKRFGLFFFIQLIFLGPLGLRTLFFLKKSPSTLIWILPAALVYLPQPFFAEFKPHWTLIIWLPVYFYGIQIPTPHWIKKAQIAYAFVMSSVIFLLLHFPILSFFSSAVKNNPVLDVSNDLYGWHQLVIDSDDDPIVGSRYQTASQIAFATRRPVTLFPLSEKDKDEWPELFIAKKDKTLLKPVWFVSDERYQAGPDFLHAKCEIRKKITPLRFGLKGKSMTLWKCTPKKEL
jgi:hypothetical protein